jgi:hypothetical protein
MQEQQTRLARYGDFDLVVDDDAARSLEMFFGDENLNVTEQLVLIFLGKPIENGQIALEDRTPGLGRALSAETRTAA